MQKKRNKENLQNMKTVFIRKYEIMKSRYRKRNPLQRGRDFFRLLLSGIAVIYFFIMAVCLPLYFDTHTDYAAIGTNKADFFMECGFFLGRLFVYIAVLYAVVALICHVWENRKEKGKVAGLAEAFLDSLSLTDKFAIVYAMALFFSYYYSMYPDMAELGTYGWYMGFWPQLLLLGSYFAVSRLFCRNSRHFVAGVLCLMLGVSFGVFLLGILNRYGINPLGMEDAGPGFISTIGNINWFCGYWSVLFPIGVGLFLFFSQKEGESDRKYVIKKCLLLLYAATGYIAGVTQGSDSCLLVLAALFVFAGSLSVKSVDRMKRFLEMLFTFCLATGMLAFLQKLFPEKNRYQTAFYNFLTETSFWIAAGVCILVVLILMSGEKNGGRKAADGYAGNGKILCLQEKVFRVYRHFWFLLLGLFGVTLVSFAVLTVINTLYPGSIGALSGKTVFTFTPGWGNGRGTTWWAGIRTWMTQDGLHKMTGVGPDCMAAHIYDGPDSVLLDRVREQFGNSRLTNAHNEWISILANLGLLGLTGFVGMVLSATVRFVKSPRKCDGKDGFNAVSAACAVALVCYTANNLVSFQQIMNISQMFLVLGLGEAVCRRENRRV